VDLRRRLGGPAIRRRRHRRFAVVAVALLLLAGILLLVGGDDDGDVREQAAATCAQYGARVQRELELSFPEGAPSAEAQAEYLSRAFADTMDELVATLQGLDGFGGDEELAAAVDALGERIDEIRAEPDRFVAAAEDPFAADVAPAFDDLGVAACGSELFSARA
jgi:hypothetical protein